jgi:hypothetical protein
VTLIPYLAAIIVIGIYVIGFAASISKSTTYYKCRENSFNIDTISRDATSKDAWLAIIWPIRGCYALFWILISIVNTLIIYPLLLIGFNYKSTNLYKKIYNVCDKRY